VVIPFNLHESSDEPGGEAGRAHGYPLRSVGACHPVDNPGVAGVDVPGRQWDAGVVTSREDLFPSRKNPDYVQTEWCESWLDLATGFGYAAEELTRRRADFGATIDQAGIAIFFLQRHRIELLLKAWLDDMGAPERGTHRLDVLYEAVRRVVEPKYPDDWKHFEAEHGAFIRLVASEDEGSFVFRYPEDKKGTKFERPDYIDLDFLHERVEALEASVSGFIDYEWELRNAGP
jgi:hypothetical protein